MTAPTWPQLVARIGAATPPAAVGRYRWIEPAEEDRPAVRLEGRFAYRPPGRWRVEDGGRLLRLCDGQRWVCWDSGRVTRPTPRRSSWT